VAGGGGPGGRGGGRRGGPAGGGRGVHAPQRHAVPARAAQRPAQRRQRRLGGQGGQRQRAARHHGDQPFLRAHDVQGHRHDRHPRPREGCPLPGRAAGPPRRDQPARLDAAIRPVLQGRDRRPLESGQRHPGDPRPPGQARRVDQGPAGPRSGRARGGDDRQGRVRPGLHEGGRQRHERLHDLRPDLLLHHRARQQARCGPRARPRAASRSSSTPCSGPRAAIRGR